MSLPVTPLPPLPAIGSVQIEVFGPAPNSAKWDVALWDVDVWASLEWSNVTPQSVHCEVIWGADQPQGALTVCAAGSWQVDTYDPQRLLDPSNGSSPYVASIRPGRPFRLVHINPVNFAPTVVRQGLIDEVTFNLIELTGTLKGTDNISLMAQANMLPDQHLDPLMPMTLRARARYLLEKANLDLLIKVEDTPEGATDPQVGPISESEAPVWTHIGSAAFDALYAVWMDRHGTLRFRSFGAPVDNGFSVGGAGGIPIQNIDIVASLQGVHTHIIGYDVLQPTIPVQAFDESKASIYGDIILRRQPPVPNAINWVNNVLLDRSGAALQYLPRTIYPQTTEQLLEIIELGMVDIMHVNAEKVTPTISVPTRVLGAKITADTGTGWTAAIVSYIPANEWEDQETTPPPEPEPPDPTPPPSKWVTRYYDCVKDSVGAKTPSGDNYGAGAGTELPVGKWDGWKFRSFLDFEDIDFSDVLEPVEECVLEVDTTDQVQVGFGDTPKVTIRRITETWSEGNADHPSYDNALLYPGPSTTSTNSVTRPVPDAENRAVELYMTQICRDWQNGSKQYGVALFSGGEDSEKYTTEFWHRGNATTSKRPRLRLTVKVPQ